MLTVEEDLDAHALRRQGWSISAIARHLAPARDPLEPTATRNCPHCQQPITIVALLATPEAARPTMPHHRTDVVPLRRTP